MLVGLWRDFPGEFLVPTYDQDLVWHAHLSVPSVYEKEMRTATYRNAIGHDDSVNDRTPGAKLEVRGRRTMELWRTHYPVSTWDEPYARRGAMWRGDAPDWYWTCQFPRPIPPSRAPGPVTEGSTFNQRIPAVELAPNVFYAPPSRIYDYTSRGNEKSGWICTFEELVPPPFERAVDPGVQYVKVKVRYAGTTELVEGAWLRFQVPIGIFPPEFIADVDDASFITTCSFPVPHCEKYLHATFVTRWTSATSSHSIRTGVAASFVAAAVSRRMTTGSAPRDSRRRVLTAAGAAQPVGLGRAASAPVEAATAEEAAAEEAAEAAAAEEEAAAEDSRRVVSEISFYYASIAPSLAAAAGAAR